MTEQRTVTVSRSKPNEARPVSVEIDALFPTRGARRVSPGDLDRAAEAAAFAFRAHLESRDPAYQVMDLKYRMKYVYVTAESGDEL